MIRHILVTIIFLFTATSTLGKMRKISSDQQLIDHFDLLTAGNFTTQQMEALKLQVMQQTSMTAFTQANSAPQLVLSLFR